MTTSRKNTYLYLAHSFCNETQLID